MKTTRIFAFALALVMALALVSAVAESHDPVSIRFSWWGGDSRHAATLEVISQFEELYPWISVEAEYMGVSCYRHSRSKSQKLLCASAGRSEAKIPAPKSDIAGSRINCSRHFICRCRRSCCRRVWPENG